MEAAGSCCFSALLNVYNPSSRGFVSALAAASVPGRNSEPLSSYSVSACYFAIKEESQQL